jgi:hypothetical protein
MNTSLQKKGAEVTQMRRGNMDVQLAPRGQE